MDALSERPNCGGEPTTRAASLASPAQQFDARIADDRTLRQSIGALLRHARRACELNLNRAPPESIRREIGHAIDCACLCDKELSEWINGRD